MKSRLQAALAILSLAAAVTVPGLVRAEVYAELDAKGGFSGTRIAPGPGVQSSRVWEITGSAASRAYVLNPDGALRGDGRPEIAVNPISGLPLAVWARRNGSNHDIATSTFDGRSWSLPSLIHIPNAVDDVDPRVVFRSDGVAVITWWQRGAPSRVRAAYATPSAPNRWLDAGFISAPGVSARKPSIRQEGNLTIIAYRTIDDINIATLTITASNYGDGPTPFPRSGDNPPNGGDPVGPSPTDN